MIHLNRERCIVIWGRQRRSTWATRK